MREQFAAAEDTPEGPDFNVKRDMEILLRMDLAPGTVLPARICPSPAGPSYR